MKIALALLVSLLNALAHAQTPLYLKLQKAVESAGGSIKNQSPSQMFDAALPGFEVWVHRLSKTNLLEDAGFEADVRFVPEKPVSETELSQWSADRTGLNVTLLFDGTVRLNVSSYDSNSTQELVNESIRTIVSMAQVFQERFGNPKSIRSRSGKGVRGTYDPHRIMYSLGTFDLDLVPGAFGFDYDRGPYGTSGVARAFLAVGKVRLVLYHHQDGGLTLSVENVKKQPLALWEQVNINQNSLHLRYMLFEDKPALFGHMSLRGGVTIEAIRQWILGVAREAENYIEPVK